MAGQATVCHIPSRLQDSPSVLSHIPLRLGPVTPRRRVPCGSEGPVRSLPLDHAHRPQELSRPTGFAGARLARARPSAYMGAQPDQPVRPVRISSRINGARAPASPLLIMQGRTSGAVRGLRVSILPPDSGSTGHPHTATIARSGSSLPGAFRFTAETPLHLRMRRRNARFGPHPPLRQRRATDPAAGVPLPPHGRHSCHPISAEVRAGHIHFSHPLPQRSLPAPTSTSPLLPLPHSGSPPPHLLPPIPFSPVPYLSSPPSPRPLPSRTTPSTVPFTPSPPSTYKSG